jgi:hypothetical protein
LAPGPIPANPDKSPLYLNNISTPAGHLLPVTSGNSLPVTPTGSPVSTSKGIIKGGLKTHKPGEPLKEGPKPLSPKPGDPNYIKEGHKNIKFSDITPAPEMRYKEDTKEGSKEVKNICILMYAYIYSHIYIYKYTHIYMGRQKNWSLIIYVNKND